MPYIDRDTAVSLLRHEAAERGLSFSGEAFNKAADIISSLPGLHVEPDERISTIAHHYGFENQREQLVEECAELIQAAQKCKRNQEGAFDNFIGELADVAIMASQMILLVGEQTVSEAIEQKLERQMRRIRDEES